MNPDWSVHTDDGVRLGLKTTEPVGDCVGDVLLLHAMMVDARTLDRPAGAGLATTLASFGFRVHRADFRGRGMSDRPADWSYEDLVYRDVPALIQGFEQPPFVMTHSLGGHVTTAAWGCGLIEPRGLVGLASAPWLIGVEGSRGRRWKKRLGLSAIRVASRAFGRMPARRLRLGSVDESRGYAKDLVGFWRRGKWADRAGKDWTLAMRSIQGPALFIASEGDTLFGHPEPTMKWAGNLPNAEFLHVRHGDFGLTVAPDHMELGADERSRPIWESAARWMLHA